MRTSATAVALALCWGCGSVAAPPPKPPAAVVVPEASATTKPDDGELPEAERVPPPVDPLDYYIGRWSGLVNGAIETELTVDPNGRFLVTSQDTARQKACTLSGLWHAGEGLVRLTVERSSCSVESEGTTLERSVVSKSDREVVLASPDGTLVVQYRRR